MSECSCQRIMRERERKRETERNGEIILAATGKGPLQRVFFPFFKCYLKTEKSNKNRQVTRNRSLVIEVRFTHL